MNRIGEATLARLAKLARTRGIAPEPLVATCVGECFLHRLAASAQVWRFVVKGGHLFGFWDQQGRRPTLDVDLGCDDELTDAELLSALGEVASVQLDDGARFEESAARVDFAFVGLPKGVRVSVPCQLGTAIIRLKVDVTYAQPVVPGPERRWHHGLAHGTPALLACAPQEMMVAEKLAVAVEFGADNTRLRDYHDVWQLSRTRSFNGAVLQSALRQTFDARNASSYLLRDDEYWAGGFGSNFSTPARKRAWRDFQGESVPQGGRAEFDTVLREVGAFATPLLRSVRDQRSIGPWRSETGWVAARDLRPN